MTKNKQSEGTDKWINPCGWTNIKDKRPKSNTEVVIFYVESDDEGTSCYESEVIHESFINFIESPIMYWINQPE